MNQVVRIELDVTPQIAAMLQDQRRKRAIEQWLELCLGQGSPDPLEVVLEQTRQNARASGLTDADIDQELASFKADRLA